MAPRRDSQDEGLSRQPGARANRNGNKGAGGTDARGGFSTGNGGGSRTPAQPTAPGTPSAKLSAKNSTSRASVQGRASQRAIPDAVANRMARRSAIASGFPTLMGMAVFVVSYLLVSRDILDIPPSATLVASGGCFLLGLVGLSFGVFSSSWEDQPGTLLGTEQIRVNLSRVRESIRSMRQAGSDDSRG
jgi:hypothetical protein